MREISGTIVDTFVGIPDGRQDDEEFALFRTRVEERGFQVFRVGAVLFAVRPDAPFSPQPTGRQRLGAAIGKLLSLRQLP